jgi:phage FluMu protein Com
MVVLLLRGIQRMNNINVGCPRCGSLNVKVVSDITETTKGFGAGKGCLGYIC